MTEQHQQAGVAWLEQLLAHQALPIDVTAAMVTDEAGDSCWLTLDDSQLTPEQVTTLQGDRGAVLDAMQYLANTLLNLGRSPDEQQAYTIELAGYRAARQEALKAMAAEAAEAVQATGEEYEMAALSSAERRQMHHLIKSYGGLETFSRGKEPDRRLVVKPMEASSPD
jgi:spoIIIJ-associated protein